MQHPFAPHRYRISQARSRMSQGGRQSSVYKVQVRCIIKAPDNEASPATMEGRAKVSSRVKSKKYRTRAVFRAKRLKDQPLFTEQAGVVAVNMCSGKYRPWWNRFWGHPWERLRCIAAVRAAFVADESVLDEPSAGLNQQLADEQQTARYGRRINAAD